MALRFYNSLTRRAEPLESLVPGRVKLYACGPTVYRFAHLGNLRTFLLADLLVRLLRFEGYRVRFVMNITDVGHMTGELTGEGEDKLLLAAREERKDPLDIAAFYTQAFLEDSRRLNFVEPDVRPRASQHIPQMIEVTERLLQAGMAYERDGMIYYDVSRFSEYGKLSGNTLDRLRAGHRAEIDPTKDDPADFLLWRRAGERRLMKWDSPWGEGFPGWHVECTAMNLEHLGEAIDIHVGGVDLQFPHHENEIAQTEALTGRPLARCWLHGEHLMAEGRRMSKSAGNYYTLRDLLERGVEPLAFRLLCLQSHYRSRLNFTWDSVAAAERGLERLYARAQAWQQASGGPAAELSPASREVEAAFRECVADDLDTAQALSVLWEAVDSDLDPTQELALVGRLDEVLGLGLLERAAWAADLPQEVQALVEEREQARSVKDYQSSDAIRQRLGEMGYEVLDTPGGTRVLPKAKSR